MVVEYIRYQIPTSDSDAFEHDYDLAQTSLAASPHCLGYEVTRCIEDPEIYVVRIEWDSVGGHMNEFRGSQEFRDFYANVRPYVDRILDMRHYELTDIVKQKSGG
jgi:quinol monooxygenase YgiN